MTSRHRPLKALSFVLPLVALAAPRAAEATLSLSFDQPTYSTVGGGTTAVKVLLSQSAGGAQVGAGNELLSGDILLSFATAGTAAVQSQADVTAGPAWTTLLATPGTSGPNTTYNVSVLSIAGIANLSAPVELATFQFHGLSAGPTAVTVSQFDPTTSDFITAQGNVVDPTNTAAAVVTVVPEPGAIGLLGAAAALFCGGRRAATRGGRARLQAVRKS